MGGRRFGAMRTWLCRMAALRATSSGRMFPRALRHEHDQQTHDGRQRGRRGVSAERQTAMVERLVEEAANSSPKRPGEHERDPEQDSPRNVGPEEGPGYDSAPGGKHQSAAAIAKPGRISHPGAGRRA